MKAVIFEKHGGREVLEFRTYAPPPAPGPGEALVKVEATSLNRVDTVIRAGYPGLALPLPHIPGGDIAGVVESLGEGADASLAGKRVVAYPLISCGKCALCAEGKPNLCFGWQFLGMHTQGGYAEFAAIPSCNLFEIPDGVSFEDAACLPVAGMTAYHALVTVGGIEPGMTVLIWGASGGLGTFAVQIAKSIGAKVIAICSTDEKARALGIIGADKIILRTESDVSEEAKRYAPAGVDLAIDFVGPATFDTSLKLLKRGGKMLICGILTGRETNFQMHYAYLNHLSVCGLYLGTRDDFDAILKMTGEGRVKPHIHTSLPLAEAAEAHRLMEEGLLIGKVVIKP